jgi:hypothetical protein
MNTSELEHRVEAAENAAQRNLNTNDILGMIVPAIWQVALQVSKLTQQVGLLVTELSDSGTELREILRSSK